eukprot:207055-Prymnesium_polylepis.1
MRPEVSTNRPGKHAGKRANLRQRGIWRQRGRGMRRGNGWLRRRSGRPEMVETEAEAWEARGAVEVAWQEKCRERLTTSG